MLNRTHVASRKTDPTPAVWARLGPAELADDIERTHHTYLRSALPRISALLDRLVTVHGERHPELIDVRRELAELRGQLEPHLLQEELVLFPKIRDLVASWRTSRDDVTQMSDVMRQLEDEHESVGSLLADLRRDTGGYAPPADGCASYVACYRALADLEVDTHLHVHKENNVLAPAVRAHWFGADRDVTPSPAGRG